MSRSFLALLLFLQIFGFLSRSSWQRWEIILSQLRFVRNIVISIWLVRAIIRVVFIIIVIIVIVFFTRLFMMHCRPRNNILNWQSWILYCLCFNLYLLFNLLLPVAVILPVVVIRVTNNLLIFLLLFLLKMNLLIFLLLFLLKMNLLIFLLLFLLKINLLIFLLLFLLKINLLIFLLLFLLLPVRIISMFVNFYLFCLLFYLFFLLRWKIHIFRILLNSIGIHCRFIPVKAHSFLASFTKLGFVLVHLLIFLVSIIVMFRWWYFIKFLRQDNAKTFRYSLHLRFIDCSLTKLLATLAFHFVKP